MILLFQFEREMDKFVLPMGLLYVANAIEQTGEEVKIFHLTEEEITKGIILVEEYQPEWVGLSVSTTPQLIPSITFSQHVKRIFPSIPIIWGGAHGRVIKDTKDLPFVDKVITGFGETFIDKKPFVLDNYQPSWHLLEPTTTDGKKKYPDFRVSTTRGCPYRCSFCYNSLTINNKVFYHSVPAVKKIIESYPFDYKVIIFQDDYFFGRIKRVKEIIHQFDSPWCSYGIRAENLTMENMLFLEKKPEVLAMGVEHLDPTVLKRIDKAITVDQVYAAVEVAYKLDIPLTCHFIIDLPYETTEQKVFNIQQAFKLKDEYPNVNLSFKGYRPYPGTKLFAEDHRKDLPRTTMEWSEYYKKYTFRV